MVDGYFAFLFLYAEKVFTSVFLTQDNNSSNSYKIKHVAKVFHNRHVDKM